MSPKHLILTFQRLKAHEEWAAPGGGITLVFPRTGAAKYVSGTFNCGLNSGQVLVLNGDGGKLRAYGEDEMSFVFFTMPVEHRFPLFLAAEIGLLQNVTAKFKGSKLYPASDPMAKECHRILGKAASVATERVDLNHYSRLLRMAAASLSPGFQNARGGRVAGGFSGAEDRMIEAFEKLSADEVLSFSVWEFASKFHYSRQHLTRLFYQYFGFTINGLKMEIRLSRAESLLRNHDTKISSVAGQLGFNDPGLFNACFNRRFGISPGEWRKLNRRRAAPPRAQEGGNLVHLFVEPSRSGPPERA